MLWRTKEGQVLDVADMTDLHLLNARTMCERENRVGEMDKLDSEIKRRAYARFMATTERCHYCEGTMEMTFFEGEREIDAGPGEHRLVCAKCGATSNVRE